MDQKQLDALDVITTNGERFTGKQHCELAWLIYVRFGRNTTAAWRAWQRLLEYSCEYGSYVSLLQHYAGYLVMPA